MSKSILTDTKKPKICVPITGRNIETIKKEAELAAQAGADLVEWRVDHFEGALSDEMPVALSELSDILKKTPVIFTFRTEQEGGASITAENYKKLIEDALQTGLVSFVDVELYFAPDIIPDILTLAHQHNAAVIISNHDFDKTPAISEISNRLTQMMSFDADVVKIAYMPQNAQDVLKVLQATTEHRNKFSTPIISMSMGKLGAVSRVSGELFGSCLTFGTVAEQSAPGQLSVKQLKDILEILSIN